MTTELEARRARLLLTLPGGWDFQRDLLLVLGAGNGELVESYREVGQERIVVVLPPGSDAGPSAVDGVSVVGLEDLCKAMLTIGTGLIEHVWIVRTSDASITDEWTGQLREIVRDTLRMRAVNLGTMRNFGRTWLLQGLANLPQVARCASIAHLAGAFEGRPAVLVSPGPSLSKQLEHLASLDGRAVVIAGSHTLHALQAAGAMPDIAMVIDAGELVIRHFQGIDTQQIGALVAAIGCQPEILALPFPDKFLFSVNGEVDAWPFLGIGEHASLVGGGSVACSAFALAMHMGCESITLVGQDLAYSGGRFYAEETLDGSAAVVESDGTFFLKKPGSAGGPGRVLEDGSLKFSRENGRVELPGYYGGSVATSEYLRQFHAWFETEARKHTGHVRMINATEGGARIEGMEQLPFAAVVAEFGASFAPRTVLAECGDIPRAERLARVHEMTDTLRRSMQEGTLLATRCRRLVERARHDQRSLERLARQEEDLRAALAPVRFFTFFAQDELEAAQKLARQATTLEENLDAVDSLMDVVEDVGELLREPLSVVCRELERDGVAT